MLVYLKPHFEFIKTVSSLNIKQFEERQKKIKNLNKKKKGKISKTTCLSIVDDNNFNIKNEDCFITEKLYYSQKPTTTTSKLSKFYINNSLIEDCEDETSCDSSEILKLQKCNDTNQKIIEPILGIDILSAYGEIT